MDDQRSCRFLAGPSDTNLKVSATKWWLAVSRDVMANQYRRMTSRQRPAVACHRTPQFISPLERP